MDVVLMLATHGHARTQCPEAQESPFHLNVPQSSGDLMI